MSLAIGLATVRLTVATVRLCGRALLLDRKDVCARADEPAANLGGPRR